MILGSNGVDWVHSLRKIRRRLRGTTFTLIAPVQPILHRVSCSNEMVQNATKHYENATKNEFMVQWDGSDAFVAKTSDATLWLELLH